MVSFTINRVTANSLRSHNTTLSPFLCKHGTKIRKDETKLFIALIDLYVILVIEQLREAL